MESSIIILEPTKGYSPLEAIKKFEEAVEMSNFCYVNIDVEYDLNGSFKTADGSIGLNNNLNEMEQFLFTINDVGALSESSFNWMIPEKNLFWAIDIENIGNFHEEIFQFAIQYFTRNKDHYLWLDSMKWVYSAQDIIKLSNLPYSSDWIYDNKLQIVEREKYTTKNQSI